MDESERDTLFRDEGFQRLVLASGGVPRDFLSLLLEALSQKGEALDGVGKDDVRLLSLSVWKQRIEELKADSQVGEQAALLKGIYALQQFCAGKKNNVFLVSDKVLREENSLRQLLNRLLDYRIVHAVGSTLTHKTKTLEGTFQAYMIDIGAYANMRKLQDRFTEIDITASDVRERLRNAPVLDSSTLLKLYNSAPTLTDDAIFRLLADDSIKMDDAAIITYRSHES